MIKLKKSLGQNFLIDKNIIRKIVGQVSINKKNVTSDSLILNYCGGGIAASLEAFVLFQLGFQNIQIYDNSMSEWAMDKELPIEIG